jgi:hypothetical protein
VGEAGDGVFGERAGGVQGLRVGCVLLTLRLAGWTAQMDSHRCVLVVGVWMCVCVCGGGCMVEGVVAAAGAEVC